MYESTEYGPNVPAKLCLPQPTVLAETSEGQAAMAPIASNGARKPPSIARNLKLATRPHLWVRFKVLRR